MDEAEFLASVCSECGTPGPWRHLAVVGGCQTCTAEDPRPVYIYPTRRPSPRMPQRGTFQHSGPAGQCYLLPSGNAVHVRPGCRC